MTKESATQYFNVRNYVIQSGLAAVVMGTLTSAIVAYFLKRKTIKLNKHTKVLNH